MAEKFTNLPISTLVSGISDTDLSLTVQSGDGNLLFPAISGSDFFRAMLFNKSTGEVEVIKITARNADLFTIERAVEGIGNIIPAAFSFNAGDIIECRPTREFFESLSSGSSSVNIQSGSFVYAVDTGVADAYVALMTPTATSFTDGMSVRVKIGSGNSNSGNFASLKLDNLAAKPIIMSGTGIPPAGVIQEDKVLEFVYDGSSFVLNSPGLAQSSNGYSANDLKIRNVAAGSASTDAATIGGAETLLNKILSAASLIGGMIVTGLSQLDNVIIKGSISPTLDFKPTSFIGFPRIRFFDGADRVRAEAFLSEESGKFSVQTKVDTFISTELVFDVNGNLRVLTDGTFDLSPATPETVLTRRYLDGLFPVKTTDLVKPLSGELWVKRIQGSTWLTTDTSDQWADVNTHRDSIDNINVGSVLIAGSLTIKFDLQKSGASGVVNARLIRNTTVVFETTDIGADFSPVSFSKDFNVNIGDVLKLQLKSGNVNGGTIVHVRNINLASSSLNFCVA